MGLTEVSENVKMKQFQKEENKMKDKKNKKIWIALAVFVVVIALLAGAYLMLKPKAQEGSKSVTLTVVNKDGEKKEYQIKTDAEYLQEAMDDAKEEGLTYSGEDSEYGLMVDTVNGEKAVFEEDGAYWGFSVNGEYCNYGISEQPVADGDTFEIAYTVGE